MVSATTQKIGGVEIEILAGNEKFNRSLVQAEQRARNAGSVMVREFDRADRSAARLDATLKRTASGLALFGAGFAGLGLFKGIIQAADAMNLLRGRITNVITETEGLNVVMRDLYNTSQNNRSSLEGTAQLYLRLRNTIADLNHEAALNITSTFARTLVLSGANAQEAAASMLQFAQAMGSGRLQGDELRSLLENNSRFAKALAAELGVTVGQLKSLGEAGVLTSDLVSKAITNSSATIEAEFANVPLTVGQAFQQLQNSVLLYVSQADSALGITERIAAGMSALAANITDVGNALLIIGAGLGTFAALRVGLPIVGKQLLAFSTAVIAAIAAFNANTPTGRAGGFYRDTLDKLAEVNKGIGVTKQSIIDLKATIGRMETARVFSERDLARLSIYRSQLRDAEARLVSLTGQQGKLVAAAGKAGERLRATIGGVANATRNVVSFAGQAGSALLNAFGGPVGLALFALSAAMSVFVAQMLEAERVTRSMQTGLELVAGLNIDVSESAAQAAGMSESLTDALKAQKDATAALNLVKKDQLITDLRQAKLDAERLRDQQQARAQSGRNSQNFPGTTAAGRQYQQDAVIAPAERAVQLLNERIAIFEAGIAAVTSGVANLGAQTQELQGTEKALKDFNDAIEALKQSTVTDERFKSTGAKNLLEKLAETDLALARLQFGKVRDMLTDTDAVAVEKAFLKIARGSVTTTRSLNEFETAAEKFQKAIREIGKADPAEGNKSRATLQALVDFGKDVENIPAAMEALGRADVRRLMNPADIRLAGEELAKVARENIGAFGSESQQALATYAEKIKEIEQAEAALIATKQSYDASAFDQARTQLAEDLVDAMAEASPRVQALDDLLVEMLTPAEKLATELAKLNLLQNAAGDDASQQQAITRRRISLLEEQAHAAGLASRALAELKLIEGGAGYSDSELNAIRERIRDRASAGFVAGNRPPDADGRQRAESEFAARYFAQNFTEALTEGIRSGDFGDALRDQIANAAAEGLTKGIEQIGNFIGDALFGENGVALNFITSLFGSGLPGRAHGGKGRAGEPIVVGEAGRELFIPGADGYVVPNSALRGSGGVLANSGGRQIGNIDASLHIHGDVGTDAKLREIRQQQEAQARMLPRIVKATVIEMERRR